MATIAKEKTVETPGFGMSIVIAGLVGLIGGFLVGIWDSITIIIDHAYPPISLLDILLISLYSVSLYAVIAGLLMVVIGLATIIVVRTGGYHVKQSRLTGILIGLFVFVVLSMFTALDITITRGLGITGGDIVNIIKDIVFSVVIGLGLGALTIYILERVAQKNRAIALFASLVISIPVFLCGGLWIHLGLLYKSVLLKLLLAYTGLVLVVGIIAVCLYLLSRFMLQRWGSPRVRHVGLALIAVMVCVFALAACTGPFYAGNGGAGAPIKTSLTGDIREKPNILWIVMDTTRADHLSCYGYDRKTTPNIDKIASEGILFENAFAPAPWTLPSHASMFTGMFPAKHGADVEHTVLEAKFRNIAEVLHSCGYKTFMYTNNHVINRSLARGFDVYVQRNKGLCPEPGQELTDHLWINEAKRYVQNLFLMDAGACETNEEVKRWITDAHQANTPFFIFINYMEAHRPYYNLPPAYAALYQDKGVNRAEAKALAIGRIKNPVNFIAGKEQLTAEDVRNLHALYDGSISYLDFRIGQLYDYLRNLEVLDNTVLIIAADHGENFGEHHLMGHMLCVYDQLLHVPLIIRYPEVFEAGLQADQQVQLTDIFPTILEISDVSWNGISELQGHSLVKTGEDHEATFVLAEHGIWVGILDSLKKHNRQFDVSIYARRLKTVRTEAFKYIWSSDGRDELYNVKQDPEELDNIIKSQTEKADELKALLTEWLNSFQTYRPEVVQDVER